MMPQSLDSENDVDVIANTYSCWSKARRKKGIKLQSKAGKVNSGCRFSHFILLTQVSTLNTYNQSRIFRRKRLSKT